MQKGFPSAEIRSSSPNGTSATRFSSIRKGSVKLSLTSRQGKEAVVALLDGGNIFGDTALAFHQSLCPTDVIALTDVHGIRIEPDVMQRLIHKGEDVVTSSLINLKAQIVRNFSDSLLYSGEKRLARALLSSIDS